MMLDFVCIGETWKTMRDFIGGLVVAEASRKKSGNAGEYQRGWYGMYDRHLDSLLVLDTCILGWLVASSRADTTKPQPRGGAPAIHCFTAGLFVMQILGRRACKN